MNYPDDDHSSSLMSADAHQPPIIARPERQFSGSQLSVNSPSFPRLARESSAPSRLNRHAIDESETTKSIERQHSSSLIPIRPVSRSGSRVGATILNVPLSTQHPSSLLSAAGERVRAYSDSQKFMEATEAMRQNSSSTTEQAQLMNGRALSVQRESEEAYTPTPDNRHNDYHTNNAIVPELLPRPEDITLIAFVNFNSGGRTGRKIAAVLQKELGSDRVYNLASANPTKDLEKHLHTPNLRVAICGGDGTVNWVLSCIGALPFNPLPAVGVLPLGTGNDTARAFGWGYKYPGRRGIIKNVRRMLTAPVVTFDRWHATVDHYEMLTEEQIKGLPAAMREMKEEPTFLGYQPPEKLRGNAEYQAVMGATDIKVEQKQSEPAYSRESEESKDFLPGQDRGTRRSSATTLISLPLPSPANGVNQPSQPTATHIRRELQFNNYLSFGIDAQVQYKFHEHRESNRHLYVSRLVNMGWVTYWGAQNLLCCEAKELVVKVEVPDKETGEWKEMVIPPNIHSIVLLNGTTYAGGRHIWGYGKSKPDEYSGPPPSYNDGLLELMGTENTFHLSLMLIKVRRAIRIAQVHEVRITVESQIHAQLDGEPWMQQSSIYHIRRLSQALMIDGKKHKKGYYMGRDE